MEYYYDFQKYIDLEQEMQTQMICSIMLDENTILDVLKHEKVFIFGEYWNYDRFRLCEILALRAYGIHEIEFYKPFNPKSQ